MPGPWQRGPGLFSGDDSMRSFCMRRWFATAQTAAIPITAARVRDCVTQCTPTSPRRIVGTGFVRFLCGFTRNAK